MSGEVQKTPVEEAAPGRPARPTWREQRWERRRRRRFGEEVVGWVLVPLILIAAYGFLKVILGALGTSPGAVFDGIKAIVAGFGRV